MPQKYGPKVYRTVREILTADWLAEGHTGPPPTEYIRAWRAANPAYGRWPLNARFTSGSLIPVRPAASTDPDDPSTLDPDEMATEPVEVTRRRELRAAAGPLTDDERRERDAHFFEGGPSPDVDDRPAADVTSPVPPSTPPTAW